MLRRRWFHALVVALTAAVVSVVGTASPAWADYYQCTPDGSYCWIVAETPGSPGGGGNGNGGNGGDSGGGPVSCEWQGQQYPCTQDGWGYFNESDGCYYIVESPPPPADDPAWEGHAPGDGNVYRQRCQGSLMGFLVWRATPPPGQPGTITPEELAARAIRALPMGKPQIGIAPRSNGAGLVGLPVWMWVEENPTSWGPVERTASVPGLAVTAKAVVTRAHWSMGDGGSKVCTSPGKPYKPSYGMATSPNCGYRYAKPSTPGNHTVTVTTTWSINWSVVGGGATGTASVTRQATTTVRIEELQVVTS